jgi:chemotaxis protein CheX
MTPEYRQGAGPVFFFEKTTFPVNQLKNIFLRADINESARECRPTGIPASPKVKDLRGLGYPVAARIGTGMHTGAPGSGEDKGRPRQVVEDTMDVKYINPFVVATRTVFKTMLDIDVSITKPMLKSDKITAGDVTGIMALAGDKRGNICIGFQEKGVLYVYKKLMCDERDSMAPEVVDAIGEITNIISGQARKELENAGVNLKAGIPTVIVGKGIQLHFISEAPMVSLPFSFATDNGQEMIHVDFSFT